MITNIINQKLLNPSVKIKRNLPVNIDVQDGEFYKNDCCYETYNSYLKLIKNATVSSDSVVYQNGRLISESLYSNEYELYYQLRYPLKKFFFSKKMVLNQNKKYLLATDTESVGHFHWLTEVLPRLLSVREICNEFILMLPDNPYIRKIALESLRFAKLDFEDVFFMQESELYSVKDLYYVSKISYTGQMQDEIMQKINALFIDGRETQNKNLYISRGKSKFRKVLNEIELAETLKNHDFEIIHGEELSFSEQLDVFSTCKTLIGIHGAGLTNCLFMKPHSNVVELRKNEINVGYWFLADSLKHNYYYYNGIPDSQKSIIGRGCNLTIPIKDFEEKILNSL